MQSESVSESQGRLNMGEWPWHGAGGGGLIEPGLAHRRHRNAPNGARHLWGLSERPKLQRGGNDTKLLHHSRRGPSKGLPTESTQALHLLQLAPLGRSRCISRSLLCLRDKLRARPARTSKRWSDWMKSNDDRKSLTTHCFWVLHRY